MTHASKRFFTNIRVPKLQLVCVLPYAGKSSPDLRTRLRRMIEKNISFCKFNVVFRPTCRLANLFRFKGSLEKKILSGTICGYTCSNCQLLITDNFSYIFVRAPKHTRTSNVKGKKY